MNGGGAKSKKQSSLADGKSFVELHNNATAAIKSGLTYWPGVVLQLLKRIYDLEREMQELRQGEMFPATALTPKKEERNGV